MAKPLKQTTFRNEKKIIIYLFVYVHAMHMLRLDVEVRQ